MTHTVKIDTKDSIIVSAVPSKTKADKPLSILVGPAMPLHPTATIPQLIEKQAEKTPDRVALRFGKTEVSYGELNALSKQLAAELLKSAREVDAKFAALVLPNGLELIFALTAAMRAGIPFVPIDPEWPVERLDKIIGALEMPVVMSIKSALPKFNAACKTLLLPLADTQCGKSISLPKVQQDDLIYGFFTSGTTGTPKCALNKHVGLLNRVTVMTKRFGDPQNHVVLQNSKQVFDSSMWQILWPLSGGGTVVIPERAAIFDLDEVLEVISANGVTMSDFVPSVFNLLVDRVERDPVALDQIKSLKTLLLGGEEVNPRACKRFKALSPHVRLINTYGPTEASIGSVFHEISGEETITVPIGKPIANTIAVITDRKGVPVPIGEPGEIHVGGTCMGAGYLNNPEKTAETLAKFNHPQIPASVLYRTGDLGKLSPAGHLIYLGRRDFQVKINGVRVELTEIEGALTGHPDISEAKAVAVEPSKGRKLIVAYYTGSELAPARLRDWLTQVLPKGYLPSRLVHLDRMPMTPNGKIDRKLLSSGAEEKFIVDKTADTTTLTPQVIMDIWRRHLGVGKIAPSSNFFEIGGDSLMALAVSMDISERFSVKVESSDLYDYPEFGAFSAFITDPNRESATRALRKKDKTAAIRDARLLGGLTAIRTRGDCAPEGILVLGATGFIGAHVLAHIAEKSVIPVTALVRASDDAKARDRLRKTLAFYQLHRPGILKHVTALAGDLECPDFGLDRNKIARIRTHDDVVVNCAAKVDFLQGYSGHRQVNTKLVEELVRLCATDRPKILHHLSSFAAMPKTESGLTTETDAVPTSLMPSDGYGLSKWTAEKLMDAAIEQGVSANVIRLGEIGASRITGVGNPAALLTYLIRVCLEMGAYPADVAPFDYTMVDCVAAAVTELVMEPAIQGRRFHLLQPTSVTLNDFGQAACSVGIKLDPMPYAEFFSAVTRAAADSSASDAMKKLAALLSKPDGALKTQTIMSDCTARCRTSDRIMPSSHIADDTVGIRERALGKFLVSLNTN